MGSSSTVWLTILGGGIAGAIGLGVSTFDRWRQRVDVRKLQRRELVAALEEALIPLQVAIAQAIPESDTMTKIVGRVHEIRELDTWVLRKPDDRPWDDADRWRRIEDAAAMAEAKWRTLRVQLSQDDAADAEVFSDFRRLRDATMGLATGATGAFERTELIKRELSHLLEELHRQATG